MTTTYGYPVTKEGREIPIDGSQLGENVQLVLAPDYSAVLRFDEDQTRILIQSLCKAFRHAFGEMP